MNRPIKTRIDFDAISARDNAPISTNYMDAALQDLICTLHPSIFSKYFPKNSDNSITEHQISLDHYDSTPDEWRDM